MSTTDPHGLIRRLHENPGRRASAQQIEAIRRYLARVAFEERKVRVPRFLRGRSAGGYTLSSRERPLVVHLVERIAYDEQWASGTTPEEYLEDLRAAIQDDSARFGIGRPAGSRAPLVYVFADNVVPEERRGRKSLPVMFVLYGVGPDATIPGHQASSIDAVRKANDFRWLR